MNTLKLTLVAIGMGLATMAQSQFTVSGNAQRLVNADEMILLMGTSNESKDAHTAFNEEGITYVPPTRANVMYTEVGAASGPGVAPRQVTISARVIVSFALKNK